VGLINQTPTINQGGLDESSPYKSIKLLQINQAPIN